tara:strand:- start:586 stop:810 length:225 start_codon:yes stop_codon:yes gene_type:complete
MAISWSEKDYEMFKSVEPVLVLVDAEGEEDPEWFYQFLHCDFKETWTAEELVEELKKDKESDSLVEEVFKKYCV